jgi:hypothetical protein
MYEYFDLGLIFINLLFVGLLLHRQNILKSKISKIDKMEQLLLASVQNPKTARKLLNQYEK